MYIGLPDIIYIVGLSDIYIYTYNIHIYILRPGPSSHKTNIPRKPCYDNEFDHILTTFVTPRHVQLVVCTVGRGECEFAVDNNRILQPDQETRERYQNACSNKC